MENKNEMADSGFRIRVVLEEMHEKNPDLYILSTDAICSSENLMNDIIDIYDDYRNDYGMHWQEAAADAIRRVLKDFEK